ncbi:MAG TPA: hypothetical protein VFQ44_02380 [Streptosporangiaceae bacterium]|nr:hypothetical protein [Streptosporangiaceae bacterium]
MTACQRWNPGAMPSWRRTSEGGFDPCRYGVDLVSESAARGFVTSRHYSRSYPSAVHRYGLFDLATQSLVGVTVLSVPPSRAVLTKAFPGLEPYVESVELGRFVLDDEVPANGESWFFAEVRRLAATAGVRGIVSFSDPVPRETAAGVTVMPGHIGVIYQASNGAYTGRSGGRTLTLLPDGTVFSERAKQKVRAQETGHVYAEQLLIKAGATPPRTGQRPAAWLSEALAEVGRSFRHPGNHRYVFTIGETRRQRASVVVALPSLPYPKPRVVSANCQPRHITSIRTSIDCYVRGQGRENRC